MTDGDLAYLATFNQEPEIVALTGGKYEGGSQVHEMFETDKRQRKRWAIVTQEDELIGEVELDHILWQRREAELGICIARREYWNHGLGQETIRLVLRYAFDVMGLASVYLRVYSENQRAIAAYERCGFKKTGIIQLSGVNGKPLHVLLMTVKRADFLALDGGNLLREA
jgi:RimJ/RimL family protein N-acetyltransferase